METYLFFKRFFVMLGTAPARWLHARGVGPNEASVIAAALLVPAVGVLLLLDGAAFWTYFPLLLLFKLVANAVDGIVARLRQDSSLMGMVLNVSTDIVPDMAIAAIALRELGADWRTVSAVSGIQAAYLVSELAFIRVHGMQNLYFGKDLRTFFFVLVGACAAHPFDYSLFSSYYGIVFLLHQSGFHPALRNRMARRLPPARSGGVPPREKAVR